MQLNNYCYFQVAVIKINVGIVVNYYQAKKTYWACITCKIALRYEIQGEIEVVPAGHHVSYKVKLQY